MKLIDAELLLDHLSGHLKLMEDYDAVRKVVNELPTAYDVDKVVEQLQEAESRCRNKAIYCEERDKIRSADRFYARECAYMDAAQIVRKGGVE